MGKEVLAPTILRKMADAENEHHIRSDRKYGPMSNMPTTGRLDGDPGVLAP